MKKIILLVITAVIFVCILAGCGGNSKDTNSTSSSGQVDTSVAYDDNSNSSVDDSGAVIGDHFKFTKDEFIDTYNKTYKDLYKDNMNERGLINELYDIYQKNGKRYYMYDLSLVKDRLSHVINIYVDDNNYCTSIGVGCLDGYKKDYFFNISVAAYIALTGNTNLKKLNDAWANIGTYVDENNYRYVFEYDRSRNVLSFTIVIP